MKYDIADKNEARYSWLCVEGLYGMMESAIKVQKFVSGRAYFSMLSTSNDMSTGGSLQNTRMLMFVGESELS